MLEVRRADGITVTASSKSFPKKTVEVGAMGINFGIAENIDRRNVAAGIVMIHLGARQSGRLGNRAGIKP